MTNLFITVVMPVKNEEVFIAQTLDQLVSQDYPDDLYEIIVADGMSDDKTRNIVQAYEKKYKQVKLMDNPGHRSSSGRNVGFKNGKGELFIVVDGHCHIPTKHFFSKTVEIYQKSNADCLCRPQPLDPPDINDFQKNVALVRKSFVGHGKDSLIYSDYEGFVSPVSHGAVYTRNVIETIGFVDETFDACEDVEFNYRVEKSGLKSYMSPELTVKYYPRDTAKSLFKQAARYGSGRLRFLKKHPKSFSVSGIVPFVFVSYLILFSILSLFSTFFLKYLLVVIGLYLSVVAVSSAFINRKHKRNQFLEICLIYILLHTGLGWGGFMEFSKNLFIKLRELELKALCKN